MPAIFVSKGESSDIVTQKTNVAGVMTPIVEVQPDRGTFLRLLNYVSSGSGDGLPVYGVFKDSNGNFLSTSTDVQFEVSGPGSSSRFKVSKTQRDISVYNSYSLKEQRNADNVDATKILLTQPENMGGQEVEFVEFRDIDKLYISIDSPDVIDWSKSELYVDSSAIEGPFDRGR